MRNRIKENPFFYLSLLVGLLVSTATWIAGIDKVSSMTMGLCLAVLGTTIEILSQFKRNQEQITKLIDLEKELSHDQWLYQRITQIIKDYYKSSGTEIPLFEQKGKAIINNCFRDIGELAKGNYYGSVEHDKKENLDVAKVTQKSLKATSYVDMEWWTDESAQKYLEENERMIKRGCTIDRVFLIDDLDVATKGELKRQFDLGIHLWIAKIDKLPVILREDYFISDDKVLCLSQVNREGQTKSILTSIDKLLVNKYIKYYDSLLLLSREIKKIENIDNL